MELFENNLQPLRSLCLKSKHKQSLQMLVYQAIANATDLPAKDVERVLAELERLLEVEEESVARPDPAL
jgi:hypothetical protein